MKKLALFLAFLMLVAITSRAAENNIVTIVYNGSTASVTVSDSVSEYVTVSSGTSSNVVIVQKNTAAINNDEITYILSGTSDAGSFKLTGSYKCTISLAGLTLNNSSGPALTIINGKRIKLSAKKETTNTLTAKSNATYNGAIYCKGHLELQGNGVLNISDSYAHGIKAKEYIQVKNITLNIISAVKDGINCDEFFWMKSGEVNISGVGSDGIEVGLSGMVSTGEIAATESADAHEDEDSGNFYQDGGTLTISLANGSVGEAISASGKEVHNGGTYNGTNYDTAVKGVSESVSCDSSSEVYDLSGRKAQGSKRGIRIIKNSRSTKLVVK